MWSEGFFNFSHVQNCGNFWGFEWIILLLCRLRKSHLNFSCVCEERILKEKRKFFNVLMKCWVKWNFFLTKYFMSSHSFLLKKKLNQFCSTVLNEIDRTNVKIRREMCWKKNEKRIFFWWFQQKLSIKVS